MKSKRSSSKKRALVRGEPVVQGVLEATLKELAAAGYSALRIEDVASRAGVNKTTIYRRWPTKQELVHAALASVTIDVAVRPDTGSLRGDMLAVGRHMVAVMRSPEGLGPLRMLLAEEQNAELMAIAQSLHESLHALPRPLIEAAEARGELAKGIDASLLFGTLAAAIHHRLFMDRADVDEDLLTRLVDLLLLGALAPDKRP
jgi:AcrR family transcriptional regulator